MMEAPFNGGSVEEGEDILDKLKMEQRIVWMEDLRRERTVEEALELLKATCKEGRGATDEEG